MPFKFDQASAVAVGTFNIYVFQPAWLAEVGVVEVAEGTKTLFQSNLSRPGVKFSIEDDPLTWTVLPDRLTIETHDPDANCGEKLGKVLDALPWTPLIAVGTNSQFKAPIGDWDGLTDQLVRFSADNLGQEIQQQTWHVAIANDETLFNLQLAFLSDCLELKINAHTEVKERGKRRQDQNTAALTACSQFVADRERGIEFARILFGVEFA